MMTENDALMEIVNLASAALVADQSEVKRQALADIYDAIASIVPVEGKRREAEKQSGRAWKAKHNYINACDIEAMSLKIPGHKITAYVGQATDKERDGIIMENGKEVVLVHTMGRGKSFTGRVTQYAMRGVASCVGHHSRLRANKRIRLGILTPEQELARTVAEQKEGL